MALETIENRAHTLNSKDMSPRRQRIISESTGLVKFNITRKLFEEKERANKEFADLEKQSITTPSTPRTLNKTPSRVTIAHQASYIQLSPQRPEPVVLPTKENKYNDNFLDENLMLELASKQREVLELKSNMESMKKRLQQTELELHEIERRCNRSTHKLPTSTKSKPSSRHVAPEVPPKRHQGKPLDQFTSLRSKPSIQTLRSSIESQATQTNANIANLRSKMSLPQLKNRASLLKLSENINSATMNENFQRFQKDTNIMIEKGLSFVNNLKNDMFKEEHESDLSEEESDISDYGCADTSNYQLAVK